CRLCQYYESSAQVGRNYFVERFDIASSDWKQRHNSRRVHDHVDGTKSLERLLEETLDLCGLCHIRLHGDGFSAAAVNFRYNAFSFPWVAGVMHCNSEAVAC